MKIKKILVIILVICLLIALSIFTIINYNNKRVEELKKEISKYDPGLYQFMDIVAYDDIDEYNKISEIEKLQSKLDRLILGLEGDAKYKYDSIDEAYEGEIKVYTNTQSIDSLRNICYILNIRAEQDDDSIIKYYKLLFEEVKNDKNLEEDIGLAITDYIREYLVLLYESGQIKEYKYFFEHSDEYTRDPKTWALGIYEYNEYPHEDDTEILYFHIDVLQQYEKKYEGIGSDKQIYLYQAYIEFLARKVGDIELEEEYAKKSDITFDKILEDNG